MNKIARPCDCSWRIKMLGAILIVTIGVLVSGRAVLADTAGSFTVLGGESGSDYEYISSESGKRLVIKTDTPMTITGSTTDNYEYIYIDAGDSDVNISFSALTIKHSSYALPGYPAIALSDDYSGTATFTFLGNNTLFTYGKPAIQKNGMNGWLVLKGDSNGALTATTLGTGDDSDGYAAVIGGEAGKDSGRIEVAGGKRFTLQPNSGGTAIGGGSGGRGVDIKITGGYVDARMQAGSTNFANQTGAIIGGGANADGENITISGDNTRVVAAYISTDFSGAGCGCGAVIGGGCNGAGKNIQIQGGAVTASVAGAVSVAGAAIGSGYKTSANNWTGDTSVTISGGTVEATAQDKAPGIGGYGYYDGISRKNDTAVVTITGGTIKSTGGAYGAGIGGHYADIKVYISGGSLNAINGASMDGDYGADAVGLSAQSKYANNISAYFSKSVKRSENEAEVLLIRAQADASLKNKSVLVKVEDASGIPQQDDYYGYAGMKADSLGIVYVYLPEGYKINSVAAQPEPSKKEVKLSSVVWDYKEAFTYDGETHAVSIKEDSLPEGVTYEYDSGCVREAKVVGSYHAAAQFTAEAGYEISGDNIIGCDWVIQQYVPAQETMYNGQAKKNWYGNETVQISVPDHWISGNADGPFDKDVLSFSKNSDSDTLTATIFLKSKNEQGYITTTGRELTLRFDHSAPVGSLILSNNTSAVYNSLNVSGEVQHYYENAITATLTTADNGSGVASVEYATADKVYNDVEAVASAGLTWQNWDTGALFTWTNNVNQALYVKITDNAGNVSLLSTPIIYNDTYPPEKDSTVTQDNGDYTVINTSDASGNGGAVEYQGGEGLPQDTPMITIPDTVVIGGEEYKVTSIKDGAFSGNKELTKVVIGKNVTSIGKKAFYNCKSLQSITIPAKVKSIGNEAFCGCKKLSKITIKSKVLKKVGKRAIKGINKKAVIKCPGKKYVKKYRKLFKSSTGYKKTMKLK